MSLADFARKVGEMLSVKGRRIPMIAVAPADNAQRRQAAKEAGFDDMLIKPLSPESIDTTLLKHLLDAGQVRKNLPKNVA